MSTAHLKKEKTKASPSSKKTEEAKIDGIKEIFTKERKHWSDIVRGLAKKFKNIDNLATLQVELYSSYQDLAESKTDLLHTLASFNKVVIKKRQTAFIKAKTESLVALKTAKDLDIFIECDIRNHIERQKILDGQLEFVEDTLKNIQNMIYGVKSRIDAEQIMNNT